MNKRLISAIAGSTINKYGTYAAMKALSSPTAGLRWTCSDSPTSQWIYDGTLWRPLIDGRVLGYEPPAASTFSWVNQNSATVTDSYGTLAITCPNAGSASRRLGVYTAPSTPYTLTACIIPGLAPVDIPVAGLVFYETATGKHVEFAFARATNDVSLQLFKFTNQTTASASYTTLNVTGIYSASSPCWLRMGNSGTNLTWSYSIDGFNFIPWDTRTKTDWFTSGPDKIGFLVDQVGSTATSYPRIVSWVVA